MFIAAISAHNKNERAAIALVLSAITMTNKGVSPDLKHALIEDIDVPIERRTGTHSYRGLLDVAGPGGALKE